MELFPQHKGLTERGPSAAIWGQIPMYQWSMGLGGFLFFDQFLNFPSSSAAQHTQQYDTYIDTGCTIRQHATEDGGVVSMIHDGTDNDEISIGTGGSFGCQVKITTAAIKTTAFECRIKKSSITDEAIAFAVGLAAVTSAVADVLVDDTGALKDQAWLCFNCLQGTGAGATAIVSYKKSGTTLQTLIASAATMVADTYIKLGFLIDPQAPASKRGKFFVNGTELTTYLTDTQIAASTFPSGVGLSLIFANKIGTGTASLATQIDWWGLAQSYDAGT